MNITIGTTVFPLRVEDNETTRAFRSLLPLTLNMVDLNSNEKHVELPRSLPENGTNPGTIRAGDVLLYGSRTLVLFYETFPTSYAYTRIGRLDDGSDLAAALGRGAVTVTFAQ